MDRFALLPDILLNQQTVADIVKCNEKINRFGLTITAADANQLVKTRNESLINNGRIEFGGETVKSLILHFCDSPHLSQEEFAPVLHELIEIFYYFKNETLDRLSDDELITLMKKYFDGQSGGSLELLKGRELEQLARDIRSGSEQLRDPDQEAPDEEEL